MKFIPGKLYELKRREVYFSSLTSPSEERKKGIILDIGTIVLYLEEYIAPTCSHLWFLLPDGAKKVTWYSSKDMEDLGFWYKKFMG